MSKLIQIRQFIGSANANMVNKFLVKHINDVVIFRSGGQRSRLLSHVKLRHNNVCEWQVALMR